MLADLARMREDWDLAIDFYLQGYNINPFAINSLEQALQISLATNKFIRAEEICDLLLIENPDNIDILETIKNLTLFNGNYKKSLSILEQLEKLNKQVENKDFS